MAVTLEGNLKRTESGLSVSFTLIFKVTVAVAAGVKNSAKAVFKRFYLALSNISQR